MRGSRFQGLVVVLVYLGLGLLGTALIGGIGGSWLASLLKGKDPLHHLLNQTFLGLVVVMVLSWEGRSLLRFWGTKGAWVEALAGAMVALGAVVLAVILGMALEDWKFLVAMPGWAMAGKAALAVLFVPFLEETFFRGMALEAGRGKKKAIFTTYLALILAALIYSVTHFWRFPESMDSHPLTVPGAFAAVGDLIVSSRNIISWRGLNLGLIGLILGLLYLQTNRLWCSWAAHAVLVLALFLLPIWVHGGRGWSNDPTDSRFVTISLVVWTMAVWAASYRRGK